MPTGTVPEVVVPSPAAEAVYPGRTQGVFVPAASLFNDFGRQNVDREEVDDMKKSSSAADADAGEVMVDPSPATQDLGKNP
jgi:hypothetical protein